MADFWKSIPIILRHEGGLADNPFDPGGITNFGITIPFFRKKQPDGKIVWREEWVKRYFGHAPPITREDMRGMSLDTAVRIYRECIWEPNRYGDIKDQDVATKIFDTTVNMGERWGEILAQQAVNRCGGNVVPDGQLGNLSIAAINKLDPRAFLREYSQLQRERYQQIVHDRPTSAVFLKGWLARADWPNLLEPKRPKALV